VLNNCIVCFNTASAEANYDRDTVLNFCCTTPLPEAGTGNIALDPQLASASHLSANSPCCGAGSAAYATGTDIDGEPWADPPSIGCDEYHPEAATGALSVHIAATFTNVAVGYPVGLTALIEGRPRGSVWDFGDGMTVTNEPYSSHAWTAPGNYTVVLRAYNESQPLGASATVTVLVMAQPVHYVAADSVNPVSPYTNWASAAGCIQDAVEATSVAGALVLVTNGVYAAGGRALYGTMTNRVAVDKPVVVQSVNGPSFTTIQGHQVPGTHNGDGAVRCVYLTNGAILSGFTLTNGATRSDGDLAGEKTGGGVWCGSSAVVSNCLIVGNLAAGGGGGAYRGTLNNCTLASNSADEGGGAHHATLNNCTLTANLAATAGGGTFAGILNNCTLTANSAGGGGGASGCTLNNCTLTGNSATGISGQGGGANSATLNNCIVYFNTAPVGANCDTNGIVNYCCTTPLPIWGVGNMTNDPLFIAYSNGNLRLASNSPCINAGNNAYVTTDIDLDGKPRIVSSTVDIGAYEYQGPGSVISYAWLQCYSLPLDGSADYADPDHDGMNNWQEWVCGTSPTNRLSVLRLLSVASDGTNVTVIWQSVAGVTYSLERSTNLSASPPFSLLATNFLGETNATSFTDTNVARLTPLFYRVGVGN
jgi:PKD repeat protein